MGKRCYKCGFPIVISVLLLTKPFCFFYLSITVANGLSCLLHSIQCSRFKLSLIRFMFETAISGTSLMNEQTKKLKTTKKCVGNQNFLLTLYS